MPGFDRLSCPTFGKCCPLQDDYTRYVKFGLEDVPGNEWSSEPAVAKFDTGCEVAGLISKNFANGGREGRLGNFKPSNGLDEEETETDSLLGQHTEKRPLWKSYKRWIHRWYPRPTGNKPLPTLVTVNGQPVTVVGTLSDTCWRGINLGQDTPGQMIKFTEKFIRDPPYNKFLVVEDLEWDVVFGLPTIHHLQHPGCPGCLQYRVAGVRAKAPNDKGDPEIQKRQAKEQKAREKEIKTKNKSATKKATNPKKTTANQSE